MEIPLNPQVTVLLVDDESLLREAFAYVFRRKGFRVLMAGSGNEAFSVLRAERVDVVVSDIRMPDGDGIDLLRNIRAQITSPPPVILITGYSDVSHDEAMKMGAYELLEKPFDRGKLQKTVQDALCARQSGARAGFDP